MNGFDGVSHPQRKLPKLTLAFLAVALILALLSGVLAFRSPLLAAPLAYSQAVYQADYAVICGPTTLHWTSHVRVLSDRVTVTRYRTIWSVEQHSTVWSDPVPVYANWHADDGDIVSHVAFPVPALPRGHYQIRVSGQGTGTERAEYDVNFEVSCGGER